MADVARLSLMGGDRESPSALPDGIWRTLAEQAPDAMIITDTDFVVLWVNDLACERFELTRAEIIGRTVPEFIWDPAELAATPLRRAQLLSGENILSQRAFRTRSGERRVFDVNSRRISDGMFFAVARDITARLEEQAHLTRSEASFRALIEQSPDGAIVHANGIVLFANDAAAKMHGYDAARELIGQSVIDLVHPDNREAARERIGKLRNPFDRVPFTEERLLRRDGSVVIASIAAVTVMFEGREAIAAIARDITEQRLREGQLARTERMASVGMLAAGVAHEINNPLAYLMLRLGAISSSGARVRAEMAVLRERLEERLGVEETARLIPAGASMEVFADLADHVKTALEGAERVRSIVNDLRVFSRHDESALVDIDVRGPLERALGLAGHELQNRARVTTDYGAVPPVRASEGRLTQVFLNLLLNAAQAIPDGDPDHHQVHISTRSEGGRVCIAITDTGAGIEPENMRRLFEPFFSTKTTGVGTGLGLSICHGIVTSLGGSIYVESSVGRGTTFTVALPRAPEDE